MNREQAYNALKNVIDQIPFKKPDYDAMKKALDILYQKEGDECIKTNE